MTFAGVPTVVTTPTETYIADQNGDCRIVLRQGVVSIHWMQDGRDHNDEVPEIPVNIVRALVGLR